MSLLGVILQWFWRPASRPRKAGKAPVPTRPLPGPAKKATREADPEREAAPAIDPGVFQRGILELDGRLSRSDREFLAEFEELLDHGKIPFALPPAAAIDVMRLVDNPQITVQKLSGSIAADPALAGSVLKMANSPLYRGGFVVSNLHTAVVRLGIRNLRMLLLTVVLNSTRVKGKPFQIVSSLTWKHSLLCAQLSSQLAPKAGLDPELAYMAGLFHNVGVLALLASSRKYAMKERRKISSKALVTLLQRRAYALNTRVVKDWNLPEEVGNAVKWYREAQALPDRSRYATLVALANALCKHHGVWVERKRLESGDLQSSLGLRDRDLPRPGEVMGLAQKIERAAVLVE